MRGTFWRKFAPRAVVVEADAFKENDVVFQALNEQEGGALAGLAENYRTCSHAQTMKHF